MDTPIYDEVVAELGYSHADLRRPAWSFEEADARLRSEQWVTT